VRTRALSSVASLLSRHSRWPVAVALLLASGLLAACGAAAARPNTSLFGASTPAPTTTPTIVPTVTPTVAVPTATTQPTVAAIPKSSLPTLAPPAGWHTVLTLSDTTGAQGDGIFQQSFIASKPYVIFYSCQGSGGALKVLYPENIVGADCTGAIHRTATVKPKHPGDSVTITASPDGSIIWELLVAMQN
jgi:hypothetical protein